MESLVLMRALAEPTAVVVVVTEVAVVAAAVRDVVLAPRVVSPVDPALRVALDVAREDPDRRVTDQEPKVALAAVREDPDLPESRVARLLLLRVVMRASSTVRERKETPIMLSTASRVRRESSTIPMTEEMALAEAEVSPRVAMVRATLALFRMRSKLVKKSPRRPLSSPLKSPRLRRLLLRRRKRPPLRRESPLRTISMPRNSLLLSIRL
jgi:hypothetical protein